MAINNPDNKTDSTTENAKREGYAQGRQDESRLQSNLRQPVVVRESSSGSAASGMLFGVILAIVAALVGGALYLMSGNRNGAPVSVPSIEDNIEVELPDIDIEVPNVELPEVEVPEVEVPEVDAPAVEAPEAEAPASE